jgi:hypothetical protein
MATVTLILLDVARAGGEGAVERALAAKLGVRRATVHGDSATVSFDPCATSVPDVVRLLETSGATVGALLPAASRHDADDCTGESAAADVRSGR